MKQLMEKEMNKIEMKEQIWIEMESNKKRDGGIKMQYYMKVVR